MVQKRIATYKEKAGAAYPLPYIGKKSLEIHSVTRQGDGVCAEVYADYSTYTVVSGQEPVLAHVSDSYSVCGDSVHQSLKLLLSIETK